jgi:hypothetical protein
LGALGGWFINKRNYCQVSEFAKAYIWSRDGVILILLAGRVKSGEMFLF